MTSRRIPLASLALVALAAALLGACSDGEADAQPYVDAVAAELAAQNEEGEAAMTAEEAECLATTVVDVVGADALDDAGITPEEFGAAQSYAGLDVEVPDDATERIGAAIEGCMDIRTTFGDVFSANLGIDASCVTENADETTLANAMASSFVTPDDQTLAAEAMGEVFASAPPACAEEVFLSTSVNQGILTQEGADCIAAALDDEVGQRAFAAATTGEEPAEEDVALVEAAFAECEAA